MKADIFFTKTKRVSFSTQMWVVIPYFEALNVLNTIISLKGRIIMVKFPYFELRKKNNFQKIRSLNFIPLSTASSFDSKSLTNSFDNGTFNSSRMKGAVVKK